MAQFAYIAMDNAGREVTGVVSAPAESAAIDLVLSRGLHPTSVREQGGGSGVGGDAGVGFSLASLGLGGLPGLGGDRVSATAVEGFARELGNLLSAGVSLSRAMEILCREASSPAAKRQWTAIREAVTGGESLADAMAQHPQTFPAIHVAMVRAGEQGGFLDVVLTQIAELRARERDLIGRVKTAMVYPVVLCVLMIAVVIFLLTYFIPKFESIFAEFGSNLPALTQAIVAASELVSGYGFFVLAGVIAGAIALRNAAATPAGKRRIERWILATPGVGQVAARFALVRFCRMLGTLTASGVPLVRSLRAACDALGNQVLHEAVAEAIDDVQAGQPLAESLSRCPRLFPPSVVEMVAVAEETGRMDQELTRIAETYEKDLDRRLGMLMALLEPLMLVVMASVVGAVVVGMLLPIFSLQDMIK